MTTRQVLVGLMVLTLVMCGLESIRAASPAPGAASIAGRVTLDGPAPRLAPLRMSSDPACAKMHPAPATNEDILASGDGGLQNVLVFVSEGLTGRSFEIPQEPAVLEQKGCMYGPHLLAMQANQKLEIVNHDSTTHNIHPLPANNREWNKAEVPGAEVEETFSREEIAIPVKCNLHPWMRGYIAVLKHPYFAVTSADGSFRLPDLAPGEYTIEAWHEKLGTATKKITVAPGQAQRLELVFHAHGG
ncbi:MAG TPA: carboxypeptidase regulatory-like domain-containing protein [Terriglobales bacterium]|nr:carboxypeptidase regulatory-like domain-containing protein [Terriglobales bacterium]